MLQPSANVYPAIIVIAHKRVISLARLLDSLTKAIYPEGADIPLVISIDNGTEEVIELAEKFKWKFGHFRVIKHNEELGIRHHVMKCGDLSDEYGAIIMLEDDLVVSRYYYEFTLKCSEYYKGQESVAGGSLFHHQLNETAKRVFRPIQDGKDVYFIQLAASWGQFWSQKQWDDFRTWSCEHDFNDIQRMSIPWDVKKWPKSSWKKWFTAYLVDTNNYVIYPRYSQTTNFMEPGENNPVRDYDYQTELDHSMRNWRFVDFEASKVRYDAYCELDADIVKLLNPRLAEYDFEVDLHGTKPLSDIKKNLLLTIRPGKDAILSFGRSLRPEISNIVCDLPGQEISLVESKNLSKQTSHKPMLRDEVRYSFTVPDHLMSEALVQYMESKSLFAGMNFLLELSLRKIGRFFGGFRQLLKGSRAGNH